MSGRLIIIRGNSGSGKSTVAAQLRRRIGYNTMLVPQDIVRRDIIRVKDVTGNPSIRLIRDIARYGNSIGYDVIIEGILHSDKYGNMLKELAPEFAQVFCYYYDISFEETLKRHKTKLNSHEFGADEMRDWWVEKDYLGLDSEHLIQSEATTDEVVDMILGHLERAIPEGRNS